MIKSVNQNSVQNPKSVGAMLLINCKKYTKKFQALILKRE